MRFRSLKLFFAVALVATGCGGGDSAPAFATGVSLDPASAALTYPEKNQALDNPALTVKATLRNLPNAVVYPRIVADAQVLSSSLVTAVKQADGSYNASLVFNPGLAAGRYTGNLTLQLCQDSTCASQYAVSGGVFPYVLTVTPGIQISATVNGVAARPPLAAKDRDVVVLQSSVPVQWVTSSGGASSQNVTSSSTTWSGTLRYSLSTSGGTGQYGVQAFTTGTPQARLVTDIFVTQ